jgi:hypothetical protein
MSEKKNGGARPGAGRPKGRINKLSAKNLLEAIELKCGDTYENLLADAYKTAIDNKDIVTRIAYDKMFVSKVFSDQVEVTSPEMASDEFVGFTIVPIVKKTDE